MNKTLSFFLLELSVFCETRWFCCDLYLLLSCKRLCFGRRRGKDFSTEFAPCVWCWRMDWDFLWQSCHQLTASAVAGATWALGIISRILPLIHAAGREAPLLWLVAILPAFLACHWQIKTLEVKSCGLCMGGSIWGCSSVWPEFKGFSQSSAAVPGRQAVSLAPARFSHFILSLLRVTNQRYLMRYQEGSSAEQRAPWGSDAVDIFGDRWYLR